MRSVTGWIVAGMVASYLAAGAMVLLGLPSSLLPLVCLVVMAGAVWALRDVSRDWCQPTLERLEKALLAYALLVGLMRLTPYAWQYIAGVLVAPVTWDDNWHFQEVASLVNAERWPPRLNFAPGAYFHFYYVSWMPAAAISSLLGSLTGLPMIKLGYGLGALLLDLAVAWSLIVTIRHLCPREARAYALGALLVAGAAIDGLVAIRNLAVLGQPQHAEWWQAEMLVLNSFSALSTSLIWVPHHLTGAAAVLLALVVATEPQTLAPREGWRPFVVAGLLMGVAAYCSIFAFAGGAIALSPLLLELLRGRDKTRLAVLAAAMMLPALPLAYIYLGAEARGGFVVGQAFRQWAGATGNPAMGFAGIMIAFVGMLLEVGWLYVVARGLDGGGENASRLRAIGVACAVMLASTAVIGFSGSNNWALRATLVPVVLLAALVGHGLASRDSGGRLDRDVIAKAGAAALGLAGLAHLNETVLLAGAALRSPAYEAETARCKAGILAFIRYGGDAAPATAVEGCRDALTAYHIERRFQKAPVTAIDRELMGHGFEFIFSGNAVTK